MDSGCAPPILAAHVDATPPSVESMSCVTTPCRPISGSVRDGRPAAEIADERSQADSGAPMMTTKVPTCATTQAEIRRGGGDGAGAHEREPEMRDRHFDDRADEGEREPRERLDFRGPRREYSGQDLCDHSPRNSGRPPGLPGHGMPTNIRIVARPKHTSSRVRFAAVVFALRASTRPIAPARWRQTSPWCVRRPRIARPDPSSRRQVVEDGLHVRLPQIQRQPGAAAYRAPHRDQAPAIGQRLGAFDLSAQRGQRGAPTPRPVQSIESRNESTARSNTAGLTLTASRTALRN